MSGIIIDQPLSHDDLLNTDGPFTSMFRDILVNAKKLDASDIHLEPKENQLLIRLRVNGDLQQYGIISKSLRQPFLFEVKKLTGMSIAKKGKPQDSRVSYPSLHIDLRGSALPSLIDDKLVFRIIDNSKEMKLDNLGHSNEAIKALRGSVKFKDGLVLLSGPTGSGKSSTLYSMLNEVDGDKLNIITIEDPVERLINKTTPVLIKEGLRFSDALKCAMRQDPDVIFLGEIRDEESAQLAIEASNTGHLVISTIHANNCFSVIDRMKGLGVDEELLVKNLKFVAAQRLIKILCPYCKIPIKNKYFVRKTDGCDNCHQSGILNRRPILDFLSASDIKNITVGVKTSSELGGLKEKAKKYLSGGELCKNEWEGIE